MSIYCVYLTVYRGNKLPPFYIGSSSVDKVLSGYNGSVRSRKYKLTWESERKNNRNMFCTKILKTFCDRKDALAYEEVLHRQFDVVNNPMYVNMHIANPKGIHGYSMSGTSNPNYGKKHTDATKQIISKSNQNRTSSTETIEKLRINSRMSMGHCWEQLKHIHDKFSSYNEFKLKIISIYEKWYHIPSLIAKELGVATKCVKSVLRRENLHILEDQPFTKLITRYGTRWNSYSAYTNEIIQTLALTDSATKTASVLGVSLYSVYKLINEHGIILPNQR